MYFEDMQVGMQRDFGTYAFTKENIIAFAREFDPQAFHLDEEAGRASLFGGLAASGWHIGAACMKMLVADNQRRIKEAEARGETPAIGGPSPGFRDLRWHKPVLAGDVVRFSQTIETLRASASRPQWGLIHGRMQGTNQNGELVFSFLATGFAPRRAAP